MKHPYEEPPPVHHVRKDPTGCSLLLSPATGPSCLDSRRLSVHASRSSGGQEDLVHVPLKELAVRAISLALRHLDRRQRSGSLIELVAVLELGSEAGTYLKAVLEVDAQVATVEQGVNVGAQKQSIVEPVLAASGKGQNVGRLDTGLIRSPVTAHR